ncbi:DUF2187 family protein [Bhargavaea ginsengi]|jgi:uncharacterized protein YkvS|nr:DUF2187 family protein [Bhargavaea ginsengi]MCM3088307.1 YkvS family protein [Bhargavaea ginsengi]
MAFPAKQKEQSPFVAARKVGEVISFVRNDHEVIGKIEKILENSVIVQITKDDAEAIGVPSDRTVVSHKNYHVFE